VQIAGTTLPSVPLRSKEPRCPNGPHICCVRAGLSETLPNDLITSEMLIVDRGLDASSVTDSQ
jgi:hypothetical protein